MSETENTNKFGTTVPRNGITMSFALSKFGKKTSDDFKGKEFPTIQIPDDVANDETKLTAWLTNLVKWIGIEGVADALVSAVRPEFGAMFQDNFDKDTGLLDVEAWAKAATEFSLVSESLSDVLEQLEEVDSEISEIINNDDFSTATFNKKTGEYHGAPEGIKLIKRVHEIRTIQKPLLEKKAKLKAKNEAAAEKRAAAKEKKAADKAAADAKRKAEIEAKKAAGEDVETEAQAA
jgi:hypothetical protein